MCDVTTRLKKAVNWLIFQGLAENERALAQRLGYTKSSFSQIINGKVPLSEKFLTKLRALDKNINDVWIRTGYGDMFVDDPEFGKDEGTQLVPLFPVSAQGGTLNDFVISVKESDCEKITSPIKGVDYAMSVSGDSMAPEYPSGAHILIKKINEKAFIDWGRVYVLDTCNGTVIKQLFPSENPDMVICKSINPDYPPFEVSFADVYGVYRVLMCMSLK